MGFIKGVRKNGVWPLGGQDTKQIKERGKMEGGKGYRKVHF
jgi:hypothetical protein